MANIVKGDDGRWGAFDARQLYLQAKTAGYLYQAHLRAELTRRLGVEWSPIRNGSADIEGVSRKVIRAFSKRRAEIEAMVGEANEGNGKATQVAAVMSRNAKDYRITPNDLMPEWKERAARLGLDEKALAGVLGQTAYRAPDGRTSLAHRSRTGRARWTDRAGEQLQSKGGAPRVLHAAVVGRARG